MRTHKKSIAQRFVAALLAALIGGAPAAHSEPLALAQSGAVASFSDGSTVPMRRVFTYRQDDGVPVFTDRTYSSISGS